MNPLRNYLLALEAVESSYDDLLALEAAESSDDIEQWLEDLSRAERRSLGLCLKEVLKYF